jgi:hypothetical protein
VVGLRETRISFVQLIPVVNIHGKSILLFPVGPPDPAAESPLVLCVNAAASRVWEFIETRFSERGGGGLDGSRPSSGQLSPPGRPRH